MRPLATTLRTKDLARKTVDILHRKLGCFIIAGTITWRAHSTTGDLLVRVNLYLCCSAQLVLTDVKIFNREETPFNVRDHLRNESHLKRKPIQFNLPIKFCFLDGHECGWGAVSIQCFYLSL